MTSGKPHNVHDVFMQRCIDLAKLGSGNVAPNPMVGAVIVHEDKIIGEGYHQKFGAAHAEVNCLDSVKESDREKISKSTLYVSLEPCNFFGKTPPCTDLIIKHHIPRVVIGCKDPNSKVDGKGLERLLSEGIEIIYGILEEKCIEINKRFYMFQQNRRPYIILKWAETANGKVSSGGTDRLFISNDKTNRMVHKWRSEEASILVGTNTALEDNPDLTNRLWNGNSPVRLVLDMKLRLPESLKLFNQQNKTIIFNAVKEEEKENLIFYKIKKEGRLIKQLIQALYTLNIQSVLVEGGTGLLQSFIDAGTWDEIRVIKNENLVSNDGLDSPLLPSEIEAAEIRIENDLVKTYFRRK